MAHLTVATWNAEGMFVSGTKTRRALPHDAVAVLKKMDADIVVIPEFGRLADLREETSHAIGMLGYEITSILYDEPRTPGLGFAILSRFPVSQTITHVLRESRRQLLEIVYHDTTGCPIHIFGVHLDDRSEEGRLHEIRSVTKIIESCKDDHVLTMGDFNAMHRNSFFARIARSRAARTVAHKMRHDLLRSMATRVYDMALGTTIDYFLAHTSLHDLDPGRKRTISSKQSGLEWAPSWRLAKIDWIFGSAAFRAISYRVLGDVGSDHRPVLARLEY